MAVITTESGKQSFADVVQSLQNILCALVINPQTQENRIRMIEKVRTRLKSRLESNELVQTADNDKTKAYLETVFNDIESKTLGRRTDSDPKLPEVFNIPYYSRSEDDWAEIYKEYKRVVREYYGIIGQEIVLSCNPQELSEEVRKQFRDLIGTTTSDNLQNSIRRYIPIIDNYVSYNEEQNFDKTYQKIARINMGFNPIKKTDDMTQPVGLGTDRIGGLWTYSPTNFDNIRDGLHSDILPSDYYVGAEFKIQTTNSIANLDSAPLKIIGIDYDTPISPNIRHTLTLMCPYSFSPDIPFSKKEALFYLPEGLPSGKYRFTNDFSEVLGSEINLYFEITTPLTRETQLVIEGGTYALPTQLLAYHKYNTQPYMTISLDAEQEVKPEYIQIGTVHYLHSTTNMTNTLKGNYPVEINAGGSAIRGSNRWSTSMMRTYLNSDEYRVTWRAPQTNFERPITTPIQGFLYGMNSEIATLITTVKKRTALNENFTQEYEDTTDKVFLPSLTELGFLSKNEIAYENSFNRDFSYMNIATSAYPYFQPRSNIVRMDVDNTIQNYVLRSPVRETAAALYRTNITDKDSPDFFNTVSNLHENMTEKDYFFTICPCICIGA